MAKIKDQIEENHIKFFDDYDAPRNDSVFKKLGRELKEELGYDNQRAMEDVYGCSPWSPNPLG